MSDRYGHRDGHGHGDGSASASGSSDASRGSSFFGASSHRSPFATAAVAALHGSSSSGSGANGTTITSFGTRNASPKDRRPPREMLYVKKTVALADFARDFADGTIAGYGKLPADEKRRLFGSSIVPIFVPLAPGETEDQYDARFAAWVQRAHGLQVRELETSDDENLERFYRMRFACANGKGIEKFKPEKTEKHEDRKHDDRTPYEGKRHCEDKKDRYGSSRDSHGPSHRHRSQSPARSTTSSRSHDTARSDKDRSSRHHSYSTASERDDRSSSHGRRASPSPARSASSSTTRGSLAQRYGRHPRTGQRVPREALYVKRYVELDQYKLDFAQHCIVNYTKLPDDELIELFGATIIPIHVPLARGESMRQYEERFVEWLGREGRTLRDVETHTDETLERFLRIRFANLNAKGEEKFIAPDAKRERGTTETSPRPAKKIAREDDRPSSATMAATSSKEAKTTSTTNITGRGKTPVPKSPNGASTKTSTTSTTNMSSSSENAKLSSSTSPRTPTNGTASGRECSFRKPPEGALTSAVAAAYIACGCRQCLVTSMRFLSGKVKELSGKACSTCSTKKPTEPGSSSSSSTRAVVDLTQDEDPQSPRTKPSRFAAAITKLVTSKTTMDELQQQLSTMSNQPNARVVSDDPVEQHLLGEYEKINKDVILHEKKLGDLAARLANSPVTDIAETTRLQDKSQALREVIQGKTNDRSAALAMVLVHVWRHKKQELEQHIGDNQTKNMLHIQRTSHEKCSTFSAAIDAKRQSIVEIKKQLDARMAVTSTNGNDLIASLERLGEELTRADNQLQKLVRQRREQFAALMEHDQSLRVLIKTQLHRSG